MKFLLGLCVAIVLNVLANFCLKKSALGSGYQMFRWLENIIPNLNLFTFLAMFLLASSFVFYHYALKAVPLSVAYGALTGISIVCISFVGVFCFDEVLKTQSVLGIVVIILGVFLLSNQLSS